MAVLFENAEWIVTEDGLESKEVPPFQSEGYFIERDRLRGKGVEWFHDLSEKLWFSPVPFAKAYYEACRLLLDENLLRDTEAMIPDMRAWYSSLGKDDPEHQSMDLRDAAKYMMEKMRMGGPDYPKVSVWVHHTDAALYQKK